MYLPHINPSDPDSIRRAFQKLNAQLGRGVKTVFAGLTLTGLTASQAVMTNADKGLVSVDYLDQSVKTDSNPTFVGLNITAVDTLPDPAINGKIVRLLTDNRLYLGVDT